MLGKWLLKRRRYFGLASFGYAALHLAFYIRETGDLELVLLESVDLVLMTGWVSFLAFAALALTSNDWSIRRLGIGWNRLHQLVYPATILLFAHWWLLDLFLDLALFWAGILVALKLAQFALHRMRGSGGKSALAG